MQPGMKAEVATTNTKEVTIGTAIDIEGAVTTDIVVVNTTVATAVVDIRPMMVLRNLRTHCLKLMKVVAVADTLRHIHCCMGSILVFERKKKV